MHCRHVVIAVLGAFREISEVTIRQLDHPAFHVLARQLDEVIRDGVANASATRVQHHPDLVGFVQADLDEVVTAAERAHLIGPFGKLAKCLE